MVTKGKSTTTINLRRYRFIVWLGDEFIMIYGSSVLLDTGIRTTETEGIGNESSQSKV